MIYEPAENPINDAFTIHVERFLRNLWMKKTRGFMRFIDDLTGKQFLINPRLWVKGQYDVRKKITSKERVTSVCFCNTRFQLFLLLDQERVLNQQALRDYITLLAENADNFTIIMIFAGDKNYDMIAKRVNDIRNSLPDTGDVADIFVIKMSRLEYLLTKTDDYGCSYNITKKECRSEEVSTTLFKHMEQGTLTNEILNAALAQDIYLGLDVNSKGHTLLMEMCNNSSCQPEMVEKFIKSGADVNEQGDYGRTPLFVADAEKAKVLLKYGADVNHVDYLGNNALMAPCVPSLEKACLLIENGIDVNHRDNTGETTLIKATDYDIVRLLVENGADLNAKDVFGGDVMDAKCRSADIEAIKFLLKKGTILKPDSDLAKIICDDELVRMVRDRIDLTEKDK